MSEAHQAQDVNAVAQFLDDNEIGDDNSWKAIILENPEVRASLEKAIKDLRLQGNNDKWPYAPRANQILRAFALCKPEDIKVIIIGESPTNQLCMENGLSFSANRLESVCYGDKGNEILQVHKALREAGILEEEKDYYCGHEDWARNGILLLNSTLTMLRSDQKSYQRNVRKSEGDPWEHFLVLLLKSWISKISNQVHTNMILVMLWDFENQEFAKNLWKAVTEKAYEEADKENDEETKRIISNNFKVLKKDSHQEAKNEATFTTPATDYFKTMIEHGEEYKNAFQIETEYPYDDVKQFLIDNSVTRGWQRLILGSRKMKNVLQSIIDDMHYKEGRWDPPANKILRAFAFCEPQDIKVIIIGTSPVTRSTTPNGLSFSSNSMESECSGAISKFHDALRNAKILTSGINYYCGHEEWAKNGVLLLNAALTIPYHGDKPCTMKVHCRKWRPFHVNLLEVLTDSSTQQQTPSKLRLMLLGHPNEREDSENFALEIWNEMSKEAQKCIAPFEAHHPTFPSNDNNFITKASKYFSTKSFPSNAFAINTEYPDNDLEQFLKENGVQDGWKNLIIENNKIKTILQGIINDTDHLQGKWIPSTSRILRAFAHCQPEDVKVIIIGESPSTDYGVANGLSFSSNRKESACFGNNGRDIRKVHDALRKAGILSHGVDYRCGHEEWVKNGVLLLNAALTIDRSGENLKTHSEMWKPFLVKLLKKWIDTTSIEHNVYVMLWGDSAEALWTDIGDVSNNFLERKAHHPTDPKQDNNFIQEATKHFEEIANEGDNYKRAFDTLDVADSTAQLPNLSLES